MDATGKPTTSSTIIAVKPNSPACTELTLRTTVFTIWSSPSNGQDFRSLGPRSGPGRTYLDVRPVGSAVRAPHPVVAAAGSSAAPGFFLLAGRWLSRLQAAAKLPLLAAIPAAASLAGRSRRLHHGPRFPLPFAGLSRRDPERWPLGEVAEQEPLPRHAERERLGRTPLGHGPGMGGTRVAAGGRRAARSSGLRRPEGDRDVGEPQRGARDSNLRRDARAVAPARRGRWLVQAHGLRSRAPLWPEVRDSRRRSVGGCDWWKRDLALAAIPCGPLCS